MKMTLGLLIAAQLFTFPVALSGTTNYTDFDNLTEYTVEKDEEPTRQEQFMWFYRTYNGHEQKRLWSITYARWVTDWIDIS